MAAPKCPSRKRAPSASRASAPSFTPPAQEPRVEPGCPVVVASAGGLEALEIFFSHMPPDPDIAFIIVSHIDPHATSFLPELLDRTTPMPVRAASDRKCLAPNEVVVTPPGKALTIEQGKVYLRDIVIPHGIPLPLDTLFRSLADDQQEKSIGLVLSGTGTDGTLGLQAIKSILGMAMAQAPQSVKFSGMPQSAIDTGLMDYILPSDRMPSALLRYVQGPYLTRDVETAAGPVISSEVLQEILSLVYARTGHSFSAYKVSTTRRRLVERIVSPLQVDCPSRRWQVRITTVVSPAEKAEISCHVFTIRSTSIWCGLCPIVPVRT